MRLAILLLAVSGCARAQIGAGPLAGASRLGESSFGANAEVGGWLRGERLGIFAVAEAGGFTTGNDGDGPQWLGVDARGRIVLHHSGRIRIPFGYGGGAGFEIRYLKNALATALAEVGIEGDIGPLVLRTARSRTLRVLLRHHGLRRAAAVGLVDKRDDRRRLSVLDPRPRLDWPAP